MSKIKLNDVQMIYEKVTGNKITTADLVPPTNYTLWLEHQIRGAHWMRPSSVPMGPGMWLDILFEEPKTGQLKITMYKVTEIEVKNWKMVIDNNRIKAWRYNAGLPSWVSNS